MKDPLNKLKIRKMKPEDIPAAMDIKEAENWNQTKEDWHFLLNQHPSACLVAEFRDQVVGTITACTYKRQLAWIGMMLVDKKYRRMGIARLLMTTLIEKLAEYTSIKLDATPAGLGLYEKLGFVEEYQICRMTAHGIHPEKGVEDQVNWDLLPITKGTLAEVIEKDISICGLNRSQLFQFLLESQEDLCWMLKQQNQVKAYTFGRKGSNYDQIGPLLAETDAYAEVLLSKILSKQKDREYLVDVLIDKKNTLDFLSRWGFIPQRNFTRMYLSSNACEEMLGKQYLISGPELG